MSQTKSLVTLLLFSQSVYSITNTNPDTIVITADKISEQISKTSNSIQVIDENQIKKSQAKSFADLVNQTSDVNIITSGSTGNSSIFLRGTDSSHTLVVLDGIILNDPSNPNRSFDFSKLSLLNIEKVEILKGSQGMLYGSNAIGGVIVITTKKEIKDGPQSEMQIGYGTYESSQMALSTYQKMFQQNFHFGIEHLNSNGFSAANDYTHKNDNDGYFKRAYNTGLNGNINSKLTYDFKAHLLQDDVDLDKGGGPRSDDPNYKNKTQEIFTKLELNQNWTETYNTKFLYSYTNISRRSFDSTDPYQTYDGSDYFKAAAHAFNIENNYIINEKLTQDFNLGISNETNYKNSITSFNSFLYNKLDLDSVKFNLGLRIDHHQFYHSNFTYKLGISNQVENLNFRATHSTGFRAPTLNQLFDATYGNRNLKPERSESFDFGIDCYWKKITASTTFFYTYIIDRLTYHPTTYVNINSGRAQAKGIEQGLTYKHSENFTAKLFLNLTEALNLENNKRLPRRPEYGSNAIFEYASENHLLSLNNRFKSKMADVDNNGNSTQVKESFITDFNYQYSLNSLNAINLKMVNLFNSNYAEAYGYNTGGRMITLGYNLKF